MMRLMVSGAGGGVRSNTRARTAKQGRNTCAKGQTPLQLLQLLRLLRLLRHASHTDSSVPVWGTGASTHATQQQQKQQQRTHTRTHACSVLHQGHSTHTQGSCLAVGCIQKPLLSSAFSVQNNSENGKPQPTVSQIELGPLFQKFEPIPTPTLQTQIRP